MKCLAGVIAITAACGGGGGPDLPLADASTANFVEVASFDGIEIHLAPGDVDNDGDVDLYMISDPGGTVSGHASEDKLARNNGSGTFVLEDPTTTQGECERPVLEKIDPDAYIDMICVGYASGGIEALLNQAGASFVNAGYGSSRVVAARAWSALPSSIVAAARDGLIALTIEPNSTDMAKTALAPDAFATLAVADLDGDGISDLIAGAPTAWSVFSGVDQSRHDYPGAPGDLATADLNRDGHPDLLAISDASVAISLVSNGALTAPVTVSGPPIMGDHFVVDVDGDGISDLLFIGVGPQVYVMRGDGAGSLSAPEMLSIAGTPIPTFIPGVSLSAVADFDHDGKIDLAISDVQGHVEHIYKGH
jgi:hypothetical protein